MSVYRTVNPKKLRPYDQPPRRRRPLIPEAPNSAATAFLVLAAIWFAAATATGALAVGMRALLMSFSVPLGIFDLSFELDPRRAEYAFITATVYGWLTNAGIAAALFMLPRLTGQPLGRDKTANIGLVIYNLSLAAGHTGLYFGELPGVAGTSSLHPFAEIGMVAGLLLVLAAVVGQLTDQRGVERYISTWYVVIALPALIALIAVSAGVDFVNPPETALALVSLYLEQAIDAFWLFPVAVATVYYVVPRATGNPLYSSGLALYGFIAWLILAPLVGLGALDDRSVPYWVTTLGSTATMLMIVPVFLVVANVVLTMSGRWTLLFSIGTVPFALVSLAFLLATAVLGAIGALRNVEGLVARTDWLGGLFVYAALGAYTFAMFAFAEHALPRLLRREWGGGFISATQLWAGLAGATIGGLGLMASGLAQGSLILEGNAPDAVNAALLPYRAIAVGGLGLAALAALALLLNLFLMYTSARPAEYAVVPAGGSAPAAAH
jgi:cytochrome c oxidase cbb3-type subunit 1